MLVGVIIGAAVVFMFSGLAINAVTRAAGRDRVRGAPPVPREPRDHGRHGAARSTAGSSTSAPATRCASWPPPACWRCCAPIAVGFGLGVGPLAGYLAGAIATGTLMAVFLANSGGAWDNAKKLVEDGNHGGKGSDAHAATVIGDTVGDPFKDTAGPAINPLIKVMNLVSVLIAPAVVAFSVGESASTPLRLTIAIVAVGDHRRRRSSCPSAARPPSPTPRRRARSADRNDAPVPDARRPLVRSGWAAFCVCVTGISPDPSPGGGRRRRHRPAAGHTLRDRHHFPSVGSSAHASQAPRTALVIAAIAAALLGAAARSPIPGVPAPASPGRAPAAGTAVPTETDPVAWMDKVCTALLPALEDQGRPSRSSTRANPRDSIDGPVRRSSAKPVPPSTARSTA